MAKKVINFLFEEQGVEVVLADEAIKVLNSYKQFGKREEAGGMLFTKDIHTPPLIIEQASSPQKEDRRTRTSFMPDEKAAQRLIRRYFERGYHYVGDWHTHPQSVPSPSPTDLSSIRDVFAKSQHGLSHLILLVVSKESVRNSYCALVNKTMTLPASRVIDAT